MTIKEYNSTNEFCSSDWEPFHSGEFYFKYEFLKIVERAKVNEVEFKFLTFSENGACKGAVVLSYFILHLDLLSGNPYPLKILKKIFPKAFQSPVVCCGIPVSYGQNHFCVLDEKYFVPILEATNQAMEVLANEKKCKLLGWKEFPSTFKSEKLELLNYSKFSSLPDSFVKVSEGGLKNFLGLLRSSYRRKMLHALRTIQGTVKGLSFTVKPFTTQDVDHFYSGYLSVMKRTPVKLEVYPKVFFEFLAKEDLQVKLITITYDSDNISALLVPDTDVLHFILVSKEKNKYKKPLYPELIKSIVAFGLNNGYKTIKMGQTSYYTKMSAGAHVEPLNIFLKFTGKRGNLLLKKYGSVLFPETQLPVLNIWNYSQR